MVLEQELLTPSELNYVINEIKDCSNFEEAGVNQLLEPLEMYETNNTYDSDQSDNKLCGKRKRVKKMCDSTIQSTSTNYEFLPNTEPFAGKFEFQLRLPTDSAAHRWTFSKLLNKVFIDIDKVLALQFKWNYFELKQDVQLFVRALPVYTSHDWLSTPVTRCPIHIILDNSLNKDFPFVDHVMRCEHSGTRYECGDLKRFSCVTPLNYPQPGSETTTLTYKFVCKTSCPSGMDRKPISVIFTLEDVNGLAFGRQILAVKICSCPKRDKKKEEINDLEKNQTTRNAVKTEESTPTLCCVKNKSSSSRNETLRDIRLSIGNEARPAAYKYSSSKTSSNGKIRIEKEDDGENTIRTLRECIHKFDEQIHTLKNVIESNDDTEFDKFGKSVAAQLQELPIENAIELQAELQNIISDKRLQVLRQSMFSNCLTPAPSVASPGCPVERLINN